MRVERYVEYEISSDLHSSIEILRNSCFREHQQSRSYGKQFPHFRFLAFVDDRLVGHLGVDHRAIRFGNKVCSIFGVIDLCVVEDERSRGIAGTLLAHLEDHARRGEIDALVLLAERPELYSKNGFHGIDAECCWLGIDDHQNLGIIEENLSGELMVKRIGINEIPGGPIDFLGYLF